MTTTITSDMGDLLVKLVPHCFLYAYLVYSLTQYYTYALIYHKVFILMPLPPLPADVNTT